MHNRIHAYVGGSMGPPTSPNDPVFWLHHCYVDKLWADWQVLQLLQGGPRDISFYLPGEGARPGHNLNDEMPPMESANAETTPRLVLWGSPGRRALSSSKPAWLPLQHGLRHAAR
jgi:hypothetical protein